MAKRHLPSQEVLRQLLSYEPDTGKLFWKERAVEWFSGRKYPAEGLASTWNKQWAGKEAFTAMTDTGYLHGSVNNSQHYAHRVIWRLMIGEDPEQIDHINGDRADNRFSNLRNVSHAENGKNAKRRFDNTSGMMGVTWFPRDGAWRARITVAGRERHLGYFATLEDAMAARKAAEASYGFHPMHGR